jgi:hypothetical protein
MGGSILETVIVIFFGFPAALLSLLLCALGVRKEKPGLAVVGAVLFVPFSYYLSGAPGSYRLPLFLPLLLAASAATLRAGRKGWAWILLAPAFLAVLWLAVVALFHQVR